MITIKSPREIALMKEASQILVKARQALLKKSNLEFRQKRLINMPIKSSEI
jgi:Xaa-Pro aminopeptidase